MATYSFKSVGKTKVDTIAQAITGSAVPMGVKTPVRPGKTEVFEVNYSFLDQVRDNLRNLIQSNNGDRLITFDYGANLRPLLTEHVSNEDFESAAMERIKAAVQKWMPYVSLDTFTSKPRTNIAHRKTAIVDITITYTVPSFSSAVQSLNVTLYTIG